MTTSQRTNVVMANTRWTAQRVDHWPAPRRRVEVGRGIGPDHPFVNEMDVDLKQHEHEEQGRAQGDLDQLVALVLLTLLDGIDAVSRAPAARRTWRRRPRQA